jgi:KEOPS complex subunit Cgi121
MKNDIQIMGFKANISDLDEFMTKIDVIGQECTIQLLNANGIAGKVHIIHATKHAIIAFERNENIAKDLGLEICVRASGQRQISKALDILGIKEGLMKICAVAVGCNKIVLAELENIIGKKDNTILKPDYETLKELYKISDLELETLGSISNIMIEKTTSIILFT